MDQFWTVFGMVANVITVVAGVVAIAGVVWAFLGRARLSVTHWLSPGLSPTLSLTVASSGANPVRDIVFSVGALDDNGFTMWGDGAGMHPALNRGESLRVHAFDAGTQDFGAYAVVGDYHHEMAPHEGFYLNVQWRSPLFPWRRSSATYAWPPALRFASREPTKLTGRAESRFFARGQDQNNNSMKPGFVPPKWAPPKAEVATDETFDTLLDHAGPVLVGFGPSFQGQHWNDVQRMLNAFAANYSPRVKVVIVTTDDCPKVSERYTNGVFPHFKVFRSGTPTASHDGVGSMLDLEAGLAQQLG